MQEITNDMILKAAKGDMDAFEKIYIAANSFVFNVALRVSGRREDAKEITQDVFVKLYRKLSGFKFESSFKTWVYRITVNTAINTAKKAKRQGKNMLSYDDDIILKNQIEQNASSTTRGEGSQPLEALLSELDLNQRACITLRSIEGLSYKQISEALHVNINTVKTRIKRARESMIKLIGKGGGHYEM